MIPINIIVAKDSKSGIGKGGKLPWHLTGDLKHFRDVTCTTQSPKRKNVVVMGRKTWESIPKTFRPLPERINIVLTGNSGYDLPQGVLRAGSFKQVLELAENDQLRNIIESVFIIGGQRVYEEALSSSLCEKLYITQIHSAFDCDAHFPEIEPSFECTNTSSDHNEGPVIYHFEEYIRISQ